MTFLSLQRDFLIFVPLFSFILCGAESVILSREEPRERRWLSIFGFFLCQGLSSGWVLVAHATPGGSAGGFLSLPGWTVVRFRSLP
jgi:hypothetical protein